jgi:DNA-binding LytR/AlgR family response regulator
MRVDLIRDLRMESPYSYSALLTNGERVPASRERHKALAARLKQS